MQHRELKTLVRKVLKLVGESPEQIEFLAQGTSSRVWKLRTTSGKLLALRIVDVPERVLDGAMDMQIRKHLLSNGARVANPLLCSETCQQDLTANRWFLENYVEGTHLERGCLSDIVCRHLGETLSILHRLPTKKFGRPYKFANYKVTGIDDIPIDGVRKRFENPLPETWAPDVTHPVLKVLSAAKPTILDRLKQVSEFVDHGRAVLCHTDLHEKQMLCSEAGLLALIDFGGASVLDPHWDLGSVFYFHGKDNFEKVHDAYRGVGYGLETTSDMAAAFSVAIAMHHASRARMPGKHHRLDRAVNHISQVIAG